MFIDNSIKLILISLIISFLVTLIFIPKLIQICTIYNIKESPHERKEHKKPMIRLGGVGLLFSFQISLIILIILNNSYNFLEINNSIIFKIQFFSFLVSLLGIIDDLLNINAFIRLIGQFFIACISWISGLRIESFDFVIGNFLSYSLNLNEISSFIVTLIWIVGIVNAINWIDGIDGLACSIIISSSFAFLILSILNNQNESLILSATLIGPCLCFLIYNYHPAKLFMGDGGSNFLGFMISITGLIYYTQNNSFNFKPFQASLLLAIPIFDMIFVISKRLMYGNSPFLPDRNHFHHRLIKIGLKPKSIFNISLFVTIPLISLGVALF
tara:strand:- start:38 stop:1021 length:984 start_codon:yes stop_codon:yes gene_type:complete